ncbi:MAG TPA: hypothetical protein VKW04_13730 [Planctomycetota bacterium]|nr:hypothetical protein [Planctomycetota bacterium]
MTQRRIRSAVWMLTASLALGCSGSSGGEVQPVLLSERADPLAGERSFVPWHPPRQMAAFVHPHEDPGQGILIAGHWILVLLGEGRWYFQEPGEEEPLPDAEASAQDVRRALGAVSVPRDAVVPFRPKEGAKP